MFSYSSSGSKNSRIINSKEITTSKNPIDFSNWTIPAQEFENIYQIGKFDFSTAFSIKQHEETISLDHEFQTINLLSNVSVSKYIDKGYHYIHFGMVQVAVKPLHRVGLDCPIFLALRDSTILKYSESLLAVVQTNLHNGPIFFNCAPNFSVDLTDPTILKTLSLDIHMPNNKFTDSRRNFALMYRVYFRLLSSQLNPKCLVNTPPGETTLLQVEAEQSSTFTPKLLKWNEITIPDFWTIVNPQPPRNITRREISRIDEDSEGRILLRFNSFNEASTSSTFRSPIIEPPRSSASSSIHTASKTPFRYTTPITEPVTETEVSDSPHMSPTYSQMGGRYQCHQYCPISIHH